MVIPISGHSSRTLFVYFLNPGT